MAGVAALVLGGLYVARTRLQRPAPVAVAVRLDAGECLRVVSPALRHAGCARAECHGAEGTTLRLAPTLARADDAVREYEALRVRAGVLVTRATDGHAGSVALAEGRCELAALRAWVAGRHARGCE